MKFSGVLSEELLLRCPQLVHVTLSSALSLHYQVTARNRPVFLNTHARICEMAPSSGCNAQFSFKLALPTDALEMFHNGAALYAQFALLSFEMAASCGSHAEF